MLFALLGAATLGAQQAAIDTVSPVRKTSAAVDSSTTATAAARHPKRFNRRVATGLVLGSIALMPLDRPVEAFFQRPSLQTSRGVQSVASTFNWLGGTGVFAGSVAALAVGRLTGLDRLAEIGLRSTEAIVASGAIVGLTKGIAGRQRPFLDTTDPEDFMIGRGFTNGGLASFPSGHTAAAFSAATVLSLEAQRTWPRASRAISPLLYGGAAAVGLSRIYDNKHWVSDVALGATVGTLTGIQVMRYNDAHPDNRVARLLTHVSVAPSGPGAVGVGLSFRTR